MMRLVRKLLLGPAYFYHVFLIKKSKQWSRVDIEHYYTSKVSDSDLDFTTKEHIKKNPQKYIKKSVFVPLREVRTGGTSGKPFKFLQDLFYTRQKERAYLFDIWKYVGYKGFDYKIVVRGNMPQKSIKYDLINNALVISQNYFVEAHRDELNTIFKKKKFYLHVYPSTLMFLVDFFGEGMFKKLPILGVLAGSEAFPLQQMKWFKTKFNIPVAHWYGHSEYAILARFCHKCNEFHFYPTYGKIELFEENNNHKILATGFHRYGTQFERYFTGDYAKPSICECNVDHYDKVNTVVGREQDFIYDDKEVKRPFGPYLFGIHNAFWDYFLEIQFVQKHKGELYIKYIPSDNYIETKFKAVVEKRFELYNIRYEIVDSIEKTISGKHIYFKQHVQ